MPQILHLHDHDNVVNALKPLSPGETVEVNGAVITIISSIPTGHKMAIRNIEQGGPVIKYGQVIGYASKNILAGEHVHVQNVADLVSNWKEQYIDFLKEDSHEA